jgi:hypothetical protein
MHFLASDTWSGVASTVVGGIMGIVGVVVGIVLDRILRGMGRIVFHSLNWKAGFIEGTEVRTGVTDAAFRFDVEAYNTRDEAVGLRGLRVVFQQRSIVLFTCPVQSRGPAGDGTLNLPPKQWTAVKFEGWMKRLDFAKVDSWTTAYIVAEDANGRQHRWLLADRQAKAAGITPTLPPPPDQSS